MPYYTTYCLGAHWHPNPGLLGAPSDVEWSATLPIGFSSSVSYNHRATAFEKPQIHAIIKITFFNALTVLRTVDVIPDDTGLSEVSNHDRHLQLWRWHISIAFWFWWSLSCKCPAVTRKTVCDGEVEAALKGFGRGFEKTWNNLTLTGLVNSVLVPIDFNHIQTSC